MKQTGDSKLTVWRFNSPQDMAVDYTYEPPDRYIKYAYFDEKYMVLVVFPIELGHCVFPFEERYQIQVRSTSNYAVVRSQKFSLIPTISRANYQMHYKQGLIIEAVDEYGALVK